jgi:hypothetical protein
VQHWWNWHHFLAADDRGRLDLSPPHHHPLVESILPDHDDSWYVSLPARARFLISFFLSGLIMMFLAGMLFSVGDPTDQVCSGAFWLLDLGFFFAFAPLFAKSWCVLINLAPVCL